MTFSDAVIPAKAGTQAGLSDVRRADLGSRLRGNDTVGGATPVLADSREVGDEA